MEHPLTKAEGEALIRKIASLPAGVSFRDHCLNRMKQRTIDALDFTRVLRNAVMVSQPYVRNGEWRYRIQERHGNSPPERRDIEIVVVVESDTQLQGHTVYRRRR